MSDKRPECRWYFNVTYNASLKKWLLDCNYPCLIIKIAEAHGGGIVSVAIDTAHNTLIIAEEEDGKTGDQVDENKESSLFILTGYVVARNVIHGCYCWPVGLDVELSGLDGTRELYVV